MWEAALDPRRRRVYRLMNTEVREITPPGPVFVRSETASE